MLTQRVVERTKTNMDTLYCPPCVGMEGRFEPAVCLSMTWNHVGPSLLGIIWSRKKFEDWLEDEIKTQACVQKYTEGVM